MVIRRAVFFLIILGCLLASSCNSLFDSYFPETVEYLDTQTNLTSVLGGQTVVSFLMGYLPATSVHSTDILVVVAATQDGVSHVLFYDPSNLSLRKSYSDADFKAQNSGAVPNLFLIGQDAYGLYTGKLAYDPQSLNFEGSPGTVGTLFTSNTGSLQGNRATYDGTNAVLFGNAGGTFGYQTASQYVTFTTVMTAFSNLPSSNNLSILDSSFASGTYYAVAAAGSTAYLLSGSAPASLAVSTVNVSQSNSLAGWASSSAAVLLTQNNNTDLLTAYSWSGSALGSLHLTQSNQQTISLALAPSGSSWYLFDSATGKLSKNRPWW